MEHQIELFHNDISYSDYIHIMRSGRTIAIDTETTGLNPLNSKLKLVQIKAGEKIYLIRIYENIEYRNLIQLLSNQNIEKIFHHATFDVKFLQYYLGVHIENIVCTKITSKILYGNQKSSSLKLLLREYLNVDISKIQRLSNWGAKVYSEQQLLYAAKDVLYLTELWAVLRKELVNANLYDFSQKCFSFIPYQANLELSGHDNIFKY